MNAWMPVSAGLQNGPPNRKQALVPLEAPSDESLVAATLAGDEGAFSELVARHKSKILGMAARFARNHADLDDLGQEIFLRAYRNLAKYQAIAPFEHWLSRLAIRMCYDFLRKHRRDPVALEDWDGAAPADHHRQTAEVVHTAMRRLNPEERLVITLLELEDRTVREVAEATGWSEPNVKVRAFRARQALKAILEREEKI